jgi:hypothetical protein
LLLVVIVVAKCAGAERHQCSDRASIAVDRGSNEPLDQRALLGDRDFAVNFAERDRFAELLAQICLEIADAFGATIEIAALTATKLAILGRAFVPDSVGITGSIHLFLPLLVSGRQHGPRADD